MLWSVPGGTSRLGFPAMVHGTRPRGVLQLAVTAARAGKIPAICLHAGDHFVDFRQYRLARAWS